MNITFLVDENLLGLLRKLRMMGVDSVSLKGFSDKNIYQEALIQTRIILTKDQRFFKKIPAGKAYLVKSENPKSQLIEVLQEFPDSNYKPLSRCFECNTRIEAIGKESVKDRVDAKTYGLYKDFYECPSCHRIYWEGSHFAKLQKEVTDIKQRVQSFTERTL